MTFASITELSKKELKADGTPKKSFLGFIFYNFMHFDNECSKCYFISNNDYDNDILTWKAYVEDGKQLHIESPAIYNTIKERIKKEYQFEMPNDFDIVFERFIQNTFLYKSELQLNTFESQVSGKFFNMLRDKNITTNKANSILNQIIENVRRKSKEKICTPISFVSLSDKKGIIIKDIDNILSKELPERNNCAAFQEFMMSICVPNAHLNKVMIAKYQHETRWVNIEDIRYHKIVIILREIIFGYLDIDEDIEFSLEIKQKCIELLKDAKLLSDDFDETIIEVLFYEQRYARFKAL